MQDGNAALFLAAGNGFIECVRLLVEGEADIEAKGSVRDRYMLFLGFRDLNFASDFNTRRAMPFLRAVLHVLFLVLNFVMISLW
jgi:hypothetical protein